MRYIYEIEMTWVNDADEKDTFTIPSQNIMALSMESDFERSLYPTIFAKLNIDKNYIDKMVINGTSGRIYLDIYKKEAKNDPASPAVIPRLRTQYFGKMQYFFDKDINYNKDIDYDGENKDRKDINQDFMIGMIFEDCIKFNQQTNNTTFTNTTPFNAILSFMQNVPLLVEPFTYNENIEQLIVPPQESLYDTVKFFNENKVLYDTPFRFFIDPDCAYLMSSSGKGVLKKGELFDTFTFQIQGPKDDHALAQGMFTDSKNKTYFAYVLVNNTVYNIDHDTAKKYTEFVSIIDASVSNTLTVLDSVNDIVDQAKSLIDQTTSGIKSIVNSLKNVPGQVSGMMNDVVYQNTNFGGGYQSSVGIIQQAIACLSKMQDSYTVTVTTGTNEDGSASTKTEVYQGVGTKAERQKDIEKLQEILASMSTDKSSTDKLPSKFEESGNKVLGVLGDFTRLTGKLEGIDTTMLGDNINSFISTSTSVANNISNNIIFINTKVIPLVNQQEIIKANAKKCSQMLCGVRPDEFHIPAGDYRNEYKYGKEIQSIIQALQSPISEMNTSIASINQIISSFSAYNSSFGNQVSKFSPYVTLLQNLTAPGGIDNVKNMVTGGLKGIASNYKTMGTNIYNNAVNRTSNIGKQVEKSIDNINEQIKNVKDTAKSLDFDVGDLMAIKEDITKTKDISKIGCLGISSFGTDLNIGKIRETAKSAYELVSGKKILRVKNDNANMIKNEKAAIENKQNQFSINGAPDLDISVLTINKKYIIKNYSAHSDKDGLFLLKRRLDLFQRMGEDGFACTSNLDFDRLADVKTNTAEYKNSV